MLENGDELAGRLPDVVPREAGAFQLTRITWIGEDSKQPVDVPLDRVVAVLLAAGRGIAPLRREHRLVGLRDGSLIRAQTMRAANAAWSSISWPGPAFATECFRAATDDPWECGRDAAAIASPR